MDVADKVADAAVEKRTGNPYKFLDYFCEADSAGFAGRDEEVAEVVARVSSHRIVVLYGRSGLGKTSMLLAGVFPKLRDRQFMPIHVRVLDEPLVGLRNAVANELKLPPSESPSDLAGLLRAVAAPAGLVLVFDQFEEFFIRYRQRPAERRRVLQTLSSLVSGTDSRVRILFSLREDYLAEMDDLKDAMPDVLGSTFRLRPLTAFGARQAITKPLIVMGIQYDQRFVVRLVDVLAESGFDSVLLQIACSELYGEALKRTGPPRLREADIEAIGGLDGIFSKYLQRALALVPKNQMLLSRAILDALITLEDTKRAVTLEELTDNQDFVASLEELQAVLGCLTEQRVVRREMRCERVWYELAHERLIKSILAWFRRDKEFSGFRSARDLVATAVRDEAFRTNHELLLAAGQVRHLVWPYRMRLRLTDTEREFMFRSAVYRRLEGAEFWGEALGFDRCTAILLSLVGDERVDARLAAATAAASWPGSEAVRDACMTLALEDPDEQVRRCAGRSLSGIHGPREIARVKEALREKRTRRRALDVLADWREASKPVPGLSLYWRVRERFLVRQRALARHRETIHKRTVRGGLLGLLTAVFWTVTCGAFATQAVVWAIGDLDWFSTAAQAAIYVGALAIIIGTALGAGLARAYAKRAARSGHEGHWFRPAAKTALLLLILSPILAAATVFFSAGAAVGAVAMAVPIVLGVIGGAIYVRAVRGALYSLSGPPAAVLWSMLIGLGPLLAGLLLMAAARVVTRAIGFDSDVGAMMGAIAVLAVPLSFVSSLMAAIFIDADASGRIGPAAVVSPTRHRITRQLVAAASVALPVGFLLAFGEDSVPMLAPAHRLPSAEALQIRLRSHQIDSSYFKLRRGSGSPQWYLVREAPPNVEIAFPVGSSMSQGAAYLVSLPEDDSLLSATARPPAAQTQPFALAFEAIPALDSNARLSRSKPSRWQPFVLSLQESVAAKGQEASASGRTWRGEWRGVLADMPADRTPLSIRMLVPEPPGPSGGTLVLPREGAPGEGPLQVAYAFGPQAFALRYQSDQVRVQQVPRRVARAGTATAETLTRETAINVEPDGTWSFALTFVAEANVSSGPASLPRAVGSSAERLGGTISIPVLLAVVDRPEGKPYFELAQQAFADKDYANAADNYHSAVTLEPNNPAYLNALAWTSYVGGTPPQLPEGAVLEYARRAARLDPESPGVQHTLAHVAYAAGQWAEAVAAWDKVVRIQPEFYTFGTLDAGCKKDRNLYRDAATKAAQQPNLETLARFPR